MSFLGLFQGYGIELEYMIVDRLTLAIQPISDILLRSAAGETTSDYEDGNITWSNELVLHVIELKTSGPAKTLDLEGSFSRSLQKINKLLEKNNCCLMPTAMHPLMLPSEMKLWPHDNNDIYDAYNRIFNCKGHGWSNLQSMHINLPFRTDEEFEKLHTAIRFLLPMLPALTAASPVVEGRTNNTKDNRLEYYQQNQKRVPSIAGQVIPELVSSMADYKEKVLSPIYADIAPHDPDEILQDDWLNSRGAIARFGRQTIEIRVLDVQEAPSVDLAIAELICQTLKLLVNGELVSRNDQKNFTTEDLKLIFDVATKDAESANLTNKIYLAAWSNKAETLGDLWRHIFEKTRSSLTKKHASTIENLLNTGSLSSRILSALGHNPSNEKIILVYKELCRCLESDQMFGRL
jgi:carboxylate-amine ligase